MKTGKLLVISGPSAGVGKDTILKMFKAKHPDWAHALSTTTRPIRTGEINGVDMNFISPAEFEKWQIEGNFLETDFHAEHWYGTLKKALGELLSAGKNVVLLKDVNGALAIKKQIPEATIICLVTERFEELGERLRRRGVNNEETVQRRLKLAKKELLLRTKFDYVIVNPDGHPEKALAEVEKAVGL